MGKWEKQLEIAKEHKEKEKNSQDVLGRFFFDLAKVIFTTMVLATVVSLIAEEAKVQHWILLGCGLTATYTFAYMGYNILKR